MMLSDVCLCLTSVAYIGPTSRTQRPRKTKIGTEVAHNKRDSDTTVKVKRSKVKVNRPLCSPPYWRVRRLQRWAWERAGRGKLLIRASRRRKAPMGGEGRGHTVAPARPPKLVRPIKILWSSSSSSLLKTWYFSLLNSETNCEGSWN